MPILFGLVLISETLHCRFAGVTARFGNAGHAMAARVGGDGVRQLSDLTTQPRRGRRTSS